MTTSSFSQTILNFTIYRVVSRFSFYIPIYVVALRSFGLSHLEVGFVLFVYGLSTTSFGGLAEKFVARSGPSCAIAVGEGLKALSNLMIGAVLLGGLGTADRTTLVGLVVAQIVGGAGYCFAATGDGSYVPSAGRAFGVSREMQTKAQARSSSAMFLSFLIAGCIGAVLYARSPSLPFFLTTAAGVIAAFIGVRSLGLPVSATAVHRTSGGGFGELVRLDGSARFSLFVYAFLRAAVLTMQLLILPIWFFRDLHVDIAWFGVLFGLYTLSGFWAGRLFPRLTSAVGGTKALLVVLAVTALSLLTLALSPVAVIALVAPVGMFGAAGMLRPAFLPSLAAARRRTGEVVDVVAPAEQVFGILSALAYLGSAVAFDRGVPPSAVALALAIAVSAVLSGRLLTLVLSRHMPTGAEVGDA